MLKAERKDLKLIDKLIRRHSGVDNQNEQAECQGWFYQPKRPVVNDSKEER